MITKTIFCETSPRGIMKLVLNRPEAHNALNEVMVEELSIQFREAARNPAIRVVVLTALGKLFSAGVDIKRMQEIANFSMEENIADAKKLSELLALIDTCPKPTIALVNAPAYASGVGLIAACDVAIAEENAYLCLSEVKWGLIPAVISPYVVKAIGPRQARRYVLTSERMNAETAMRLGLIHSVVSAGELEATGETVVTDILKGSPHALKAAKDLIHCVTSHSPDRPLHEELVLRLANIRVSKEGKEGIKAFIHKELPPWVEADEATGYS